jgi:hypothetical protein
MATIEQSVDVVGVGFRMKHDVRVVLDEIVKKKPLRVDLQREPENEYDENAIKVVLSDPRAGQLDGHHLGYLGRPVAEVLAPRLDGEEVVVDSAKLTVLYPAESTRDDLSTGNIDLVLVKL